MNHHKDSLLYLWVTDDFHYLLQEQTEPSGPYIAPPMYDKCLSFPYLEIYSVPSGSYH